MSPRAVILKSKNWDEFNQNLIELSDKEKGNTFELLTKYLFKVVPNYSNIYKQVWIHHELPEKLKKKFNYSDDIGIDLFAEHISGEYHAIQCKYHSDKNKNVTRNELNGFLAVLQSRPSLTLGYICSSSNGYSKNIEKSISKPPQYILSDKWQFYIDEYMWAIHKYINEKAFNIKPHDPRDHQLKAIEEAKKHFKSESRGKLIFPCGAGKSLTGFWLTQELKSKNTLIAVPSLSLIKQTLDVYLREIVANKDDVRWLCICSDDGIGKDDDVVFKTENIGVPCQTDPEYIENWLKENKNAKKIVFTTYQSGKIIAELSKKLKLKFDVGIFDEAHKTVGSSKKLFSHLLFEKNISIDKRIFMTATERFYGGKKSEDIISMDDEDIYGDTFSMMSFKEAINAHLLTDYKVITIDVKKNEVSEFIRENKLVELNGNWAKESESRALASMLALRKAMTLFPITNAVSFHSSIERAKRNLSLQDHITETYNYEPIDTFTVKGKDPTSLRTKIISEFAESKKALITNARCLTEGIDVPNIDCIIFTDPKRSKVDIVQALGRALRKKEGKDWGYVILPVIYDDKTNEIDNDNFDDILSVVRGLAANDERIVDYFKDKESVRLEKSKAGERIFNFEVFSEYIDESELKENLQIKLWEKLSQFQWLAFEEAREFVWKLEIKRQQEWRNYIKSKSRNSAIPTNPDNVYKYKGWLSWGDFLGYSPGWDGLWMPFVEARDYVRKLGFLKKKDYLDWKANEKTPFNIPFKAHKVYLNQGWLSWGDFLGYSPGWDGKYRSFTEARKFVRTLKIKSISDWNLYCESGKKPYDIPHSGYITYKNKGWVSTSDYFGYNRDAPQLKVYRGFEEARKFVRKLNLRNLKEWQAYAISGKKPDDIPSNPQNTYKKSGDWRGYTDWLGSNNISTLTKSKNFWPFEKARKYARNLGLSSYKEWQDYCRSKDAPEGLPSNLFKAYRDKGWEGIDDFLGKEKK